LYAIGRVLGVGDGWCRVRDEQERSRGAHRRARHRHDETGDRVQDQLRRIGRRIHRRWLSHSDETDARDRLGGMGWRHLRSLQRRRVGVHLEPKVERVFPRVDLVVGEGVDVRLGEQEPGLSNRERVRRMQPGPFDRFGDLVLVTSAGVTGRSGSVGIGERVRSNPNRPVRGSQFSAGWCFGVRRSMASPSDAAPRALALIRWRSASRSFSKRCP
jgi:hypothetical protein